MSQTQRPLPGNGSTSTDEEEAVSSIDRPNAVSVLSRLKGKIDANKASEELKREKKKREKKKRDDACCFCGC